MAGFGDAALGTTLVAMNLVVVCLLVGYLNSNAVQPGSRRVLVVAMGLVCVGPTRCAPSSRLLEFHTSTAW